MGSKAERTAKPAAAAMPAAGRSRTSARRAAPARASAPVRSAPAAPRARASARPKPLRAESDAPFARRAVFEELESRLLMSADLNPVAQETLLAAPALQGAEFRALSDDGSAVTKSAVAAVQRTNELIFIDPRVPDREQLLAGLTAQSAEGRQFEVITLDASRDGIAQVTDALRGRIQVDAVHFITHGADGAVQLGGTWLDAKTLAANAEAVAGWGDSLKQDADVLFYGCDLASSASGRALMQWIAELTRGDVAASTDATGAAGQGGDWELEAKVGAIETQVAVAADARASWSHVLSGVPSGARSPVNIDDQQCAGLAGGRDRAGRSLRRRLERPGSGRLRWAFSFVSTTRTGRRRASRSSSIRPPAAPSLRRPSRWTPPETSSWHGAATGPATTTGVFIRRFNAAGNPLGRRAARVNVAVGNNQSAPTSRWNRTATSPSSGRATRPANLEIWMRRYPLRERHADRGSPGLNQRATTTPNPTIAMDDDGDFVVTWESQDANSRVSSRGATTTPASPGRESFPVNATTSGEPAASRCRDGRESATSVVVWDGEGATDNKGIYGRR